MQLESQPKYPWFFPDFQIQYILGPAANVLKHNITLQKQVISLQKQIIKIEKQGLSTEIATQLLPTDHNGASTINEYMSHHRHMESQDEEVEKHGYEQITTRLAANVIK